MHKRRFETACLLLGITATAHAAGVLENPGQGATVSGIGLISGWYCGATRVELEIDGTSRTAVPYGSDRADTASACSGARNNGFGVLTNWALLGPGAHTIRALADGTEFARATFTVTSLGSEFLKGKSAGTTIYDFPAAGKSTVLTWQESSQSFVASEVRGDAPSLWGRWNGVNLEARSNCTSPQNNGTHGTYAQFDIANDGGVFTIAEAAVTGLTCTYNGTYSQDGTQRQAKGTYFCSDGKQGSFTTTGFSVGPTQMQVRMDVKLTGKETCTVDAMISAARF